MLGNIDLTSTCAYNDSPWETKREDQEFKVALGYRVPSQPNKNKAKRNRLVVRVEK